MLYILRTGSGFISAVLWQPTLAVQAVPNLHGLLLQLPPTFATVADADAACVALP
jgi:hypothetical protein